MQVYKSFIAISISVALIVTSVYPSIAQAGEMVSVVMPAVGRQVYLSPAYTPAHLQGMSIDTHNPFKFDFFIHKGDGQLSDGQKKEEYTKLVKYFLASLTVPDKDQWVNLSPYEHSRMITDDFGKTAMGRDLLAQDYLLKQITSSLMYPESGLGKSFWDKVYAQAWEKYHTTSIPFNTFNKIWIVPDQAIIFEKDNTAYIIKSHLKVMLEEDYLSLHKHKDVGVLSSGIPKSYSKAIDPRVRLTWVSPSFGHPNIGELSSQVTNQTQSIIRQIILPAIEKEVNEGKNFALLRQIVSGMILATWYKKSLRESILNRIYADKAKIQGVGYVSSASVVDPEFIYQQYLKAFKKGVYSYIKQDEDKYTHELVPRKYFSGGFGAHNEEMVGVVHAISGSNVSAAMRAWANADQDIDRASIVLEQSVDEDSSVNKAMVLNSEQQGQIKNILGDLINTFMSIKYDVSFKLSRSFRDRKPTPSERSELAKERHYPKVIKALTKLVNPQMLDEDNQVFDSKVGGFDKTYGQLTQRFMDFYTLVAQIQGNDSIFDLDPGKGVVRLSELGTQKDTVFWQEYHAQMSSLWADAVLGEVKDFIDFESMGIRELPQLLSIYADLEGLKKSQARDITLSSSPSFRGYEIKKRLIENILKKFEKLQQLDFISLSKKNGGQSIAIKIEPTAAYDETRGRELIQQLIIMLQESIRKQWRMVFSHYMEIGDGREAKACVDLLGQIPAIFDHEDLRQINEQLEEMGASFLGDFWIHLSRSEYGQARQVLSMIRTEGLNDRQKIIFLKVSTMLELIEERSQLQDWQTRFDALVAFLSNGLTGRQAKPDYSSAEIILRRVDSFIERCEMAHFPIDEKKYDTGQARKRLSLLEGLRRDRGKSSGFSFESLGAVVRNAYPAEVIEAFGVLGIQPTRDREKIRRKWKSLLRVNHTDTKGLTEGQAGFKEATDLVGRINAAKDKIFAFLDAAMGPGVPSAVILGKPDNTVVSQLHRLMGDYLPDSEMESWRVYAKMLGQEGQAFIRTVDAEIAVQSHVIFRRLEQRIAQKQMPNWALIEIINSMEDIDATLKAELITSLRNKSISQENFLTSGDLGAMISDKVAKNYDFYVGQEFRRYKERVRSNVLNDDLFGNHLKLAARFIRRHERSSELASLFERYFELSRTKIGTRLISDRIKRITGIKKEETIYEIADFMFSGLFEDDNFYLFERMNDYRLMLTKVYARYVLRITDDFDEGLNIGIFPYDTDEEKARERFGRIVGLARAKRLPPRTFAQTLTKDGLILDPNTVAMNAAMSVTDRAMGPAQQEVMIFGKPSQGILRPFYSLVSKYIPGNFKDNWREYLKLLGQDGRDFRSLVDEEINLQAQAVLRVSATHDQDQQQIPLSPFIDNLKQMVNIDQALSDRLIANLRDHTALQKQVLTRGELKGIVKAEIKRRYDTQLQEVFKDLNGYITDDVLDDQVLNYGLGVAVYLINRHQDREFLMQLLRAIYDNHMNMTDTKFVERQIKLKTHIRRTETIHDIAQFLFDRQHQEGLFWEQAETPRYRLELTKLYGRYVLRLADQDDEHVRYGMLFEKDETMARSKFQDIVSFASGRRGLPGFLFLALVENYGVLNINGLRANAAMSVNSRNEQDKLFGDFAMIDPQSPLGILAQEYGIEFHVPSSAQAQGYWQYDFPLTDFNEKQRIALYRHLIPSFKNDDFTRPLKLSLVFKDHQPLVLVADITKQAGASDLGSRELNHFKDDLRRLKFEMGFLKSDSQGQEYEAISDFSSVLQEIRSQGLSIGLGVAILDNEQDKITMDEAYQFISQHRSTLLARSNLFSSAKVDFQDLPIITFPGVYRSREFSSRFYRKYMRPKKDSVSIVLGSGSGADAIEAARHSAKVFAIDNNPIAVANTKYNAERSAYGSRIEVLRGDLFRTSGGTIPLGIADQIYFNMPLMFQEESDPAVHDFQGDLLVRVLRESGDYLKEGGTLEISNYESPFTMAAIFNAGWDIVSIEGTDDSRARNDLGWDYVKFTLVRASENPERQKELDLIKGQWKSLNAFYQGLKGENSNPLAQLGIARVLSQRILGSRFENSFHASLLSKGLHSLIGILSHNVDRVDVPNFRGNPDYEERWRSSLKQDIVPLNDGQIAGVRGLLQKAKALMLDQDLRTQREIKPDGTDVTKADIEIQRLFDQALPQIVPGSIVFGEESFNSEILEKAKTTEYVWVFDPIDGTTTYANGGPEYSSALILLRYGQPVYSAVLAPEYQLQGQKGILLEAFADRQGVYLNGSDEPLASLKERDGDLKDSLFAYYQSSRTAPLVFLDEVKKEAGASYDNKGHSSYIDVMRILTHYLNGTADPFVPRVLSVTACAPWDIWAGAWMIEKAGGTASYVYGTPMFPADFDLIQNDAKGKPRVPASIIGSPKAHREVLEQSLEAGDFAMKVKGKGVVKIFGVVVPLNRRDLKIYLKARRLIKQIANVSVAIPSVRNGLMLNMMKNFFVTGNLDGNEAEYFAHAFVDLWRRDPVLRQNTFSPYLILFKSFEDIVEPAYEMMKYYSMADSFLRSASRQERLQVFYYATVSNYFHIVDIKPHKETYGDKSIYFDNDFLTGDDKQLGILHRFITDLLDYKSSPAVLASDGAYRAYFQYEWAIALLLSTRIHKTDGIASVIKRLVNSFENTAFDKRRKEIEDLLINILTRTQEAWNAQGLISPHLSEAEAKSLNAIFLGHHSWGRPMSFQSSYKNYEEDKSIKKEMVEVFTSPELSRIFPRLAQALRSNRAMKTTDADLGGIDLNSRNMAMLVQHEGRGIELLLANQDMAQLSAINGLSPEILEISPAINLPILQELKEAVH